MKMFGQFETDELNERAPTVGGGTLESDAYTGTIKLAYAGKSPNSNAQFIALHIDVNGFEYKEQIYITNRDGEPFYLDKKDQSKQMLPGLVHINHACLVTTGYELKDQDVEEKVVKLWDFEKGAETNQTVPVLVDLIGKEIGVGIKKETVDKRKKGDDGQYHNTGETRDENKVDIVFHAESGRIVNEIRAGEETASFMERWKRANQGKTRNRSKGTGSKGTPGVPGTKSKLGPLGGGGGSAPAKKPSNFFG